MSSDFVQKLVAKAGNGTVQLQWDDTHGVGVNIYRSTDTFVDIFKNQLNKDVGVNNGATLFNNGRKILFDGTKIHVVWRDFSGDIVYTKSIDNGQSFSPRYSVSSNGFTPKPIAYYPSMVLDKDGNVHIAWSANYKDSYDIYYVNNVSGSFGVPINATIGATYASVPSIGVNSIGTVYVAYEDITSDTFTKIYVSTIINSGGVYSVGDVGIVSGSNNFIRYKNPCLVVDSNNVVTVVWIGDNFADRFLFYNHNSSGGFMDEPKQLFVGSGSDNNVLSAHLSADVYGNIYLAYANKSDMNVNSSIKFSSNIGGAGFSSPVVLSQESSMADLPTIVIRDSGNVNTLQIYVLWEDNFSDMSGTSVYHAMVTLPTTYTYLGVFYDEGRNVKGISGIAMANSQLGAVWTEYNGDLVPDFNVVFFRRTVGIDGILIPSSSGTQVNTTPVTNNYYVDSNLKNGILYYYITKMVDSTVFSPQVSSTPYFTQTIDPPVANNLVAVSGYSGVRLSWDKVNLDQYDGYNVYRMIGRSGSVYTKIASSIRSSDYFDSNVVNGTTYVYVVTVIDKNIPSNESANSNIAVVVYNSTELVVVNSPFVIYGRVIVTPDTDLHNVQVSVYDQRNNKFTVGILDTITGYYVINLANESFSWSLGDVIKVEALEGTKFGSDSTYAILTQSPQLVRDLDLTNSIIGKNVSVTIRDGHLVNHRAVTLDLIAQNAQEMIISENADFSASSWEAFSLIKLFVLSVSDGAKTVYAKFRDGSNSESNIVSDKTVLDTQAPTGVGFFIKEKSPTSDLNIHLIMVGNAYQFIASESPNFKDASWTSFAREVSFTLSDVIGTKIVYVKFRDEALNETSVYQNSIVYLLLPPKPRLITPILGDTSNKPQFTFTVDQNVPYSIQYEIEFSNNGFRTIDNVKDQAIDAFGWMDKYGNYTSSYTGNHTAIYDMPDYKDGLGMTRGRWQWRSRAKNRYGHGPYSDEATFYIGMYDTNYADTSLVGIDYWQFFLMKQPTAYLYWSDGEIHLPQGVYKIMSNNKVPVDPTKYPANLNLPVTLNWDWWMVLKWRPDITNFTIGNSGIRFVDADKINDLLKLDNNWIPVLYFPNGEKVRVPAVGSSLVSRSQDNVELDNTLNINDMVLRDHINNVKIHSGVPFDLPYVGMGNGDATNPAIFTINNITQDIIYSRGITAKAYGIGMAGISSKQEFTGLDIDGIGLFAQGDVADVMLNHGTLYGRNGIVDVGTDDDSLSVVITEDTIDGIVGTNISTNSDVDNMPVGIMVSANGIAGVGVSNYVGAFGNGSLADIMLENGSIITTDGNGDLIVNGSVLNSKSLLVGKNV